MGAENNERKANSGRARRRTSLNTSNEASSRYAYHDQMRVEHLRPSTGDKAPGEVRVGQGSRVRRRHLSDPPVIDSWPPMPSVPAGALAASDAARDATGAHVPDEGRAQSSAMAMAISAVATARPAAEDEPESVEPRAFDNETATSDISAARIPGQVTPAGAVSAAEGELEKLEQLVARGAWEDVAKLGCDPTHPALHRLMHVLALRETLPSDAKGAGQLTQNAMVILSELMGVSPTSPLSLMLAKRLLRRNPVWTHHQPATGISAGIVILGLLVGCGIGWVLTRYVL